MMWIPLRRRDGSIKAYALVDDADYDAVSQSPWHVGTGGYARRCPEPPGGASLMHRQLLGLMKGDPRQGDHINGDRLDNRRSNLRIVSASGNAQNRRRGDRGRYSQFRGVSRRPLTDTGPNPWSAYIKVDGQMRSVGCFATELEAAEAAAYARAMFMPYSPEATGDRGRVLVGGEPDGGKVADTPSRQPDSAAVAADAAELTSPPTNTRRKLVV